MPLRFTLPKTARRPRYSICTRRGKQNNTNDPRRKAGIFYARSSQAGYPPSFCSGAAAARSRPPGPAAGFGFSGRAARRLGSAVWGAHPLRAGADARLCGGLLRCLCGRGSAGAAAPWVRGAVAGQHLSALRHRGRRSGTVALAGSEATGTRASAKAAACRSASFASSKPSINAWNRSCQFCFAPSRTKTDPSPIAARSISGNSRGTRTPPVRFSPACTCSATLRPNIGSSFGWIGRTRSSSILS